MPTITTFDIIIAIAGAFIGVIITLIINAVNNRTSYRNDYYKMIIQKRMEAYSSANNLVKNLNTTVIDDKTHKAYPVYFGYETEKHFTEMLSVFLTARNQGMWYSDSLNDILDDLNKIFFQINVSDNERVNIETGIKHYEAIADCRKKMESTIKKDLIKLHKVRKFLRTKRKHKIVEYCFTNDHQ